MSVPHILIYVYGCQNLKSFFCHPSIFDRSWIIEKKIGIVNFWNMKLIPTPSYKAEWAGWQERCGHGSHSHSIKQYGCNISGFGLLDHVFSNRSMDCKWRKQLLPEWFNIRRHKSNHHINQVHLPTTLFPACFLMLCSISEAFCSRNISHKHTRLLHTSE